ncbi:hypothetical protein F5Y06DRAFT_293068 [Hypoxylon sp. FL0890]|nr:hypothetical protein F5Y06DRAFT_293068 [Hypoxylon sp. FL0890]
MAQVDKKVDSDNASAPSHPVKEEPAAFYSIENQNGNKPRVCHFRPVYDFDDITTRFWKTDPNKYVTKGPPSAEDVEFLVLDNRRFDAEWNEDRYWHAVAYNLMRPARASIYVADAPHAVCLDAGPDVANHGGSVHRTHGDVPHEQFCGRQQRYLRQTHGVCGREIFPAYGSQ